MIGCDELQPGLNIGQSSFDCLKREKIRDSCSQENGAFVLLPMNLKNTAWGSRTYLDRYSQESLV